MVSATLQNNLACNYDCVYIYLQAKSSSLIIINELLSLFADTLQEEKNNMTIKKE